MEEVIYANNMYSRYSTDTDIYVCTYIHAYVK